MLSRTNTAVPGLFLIGLVLTGCGGRASLAPVTGVDTASDERPEMHTVRKGETLYAVAWQHGLDYRTLAAWNRLTHPFVIHPGQVLVLSESSIAEKEVPKQASVATAALPEDPDIEMRPITELEGNEPARDSASLPVDTAGDEDASGRQIGNGSDGAASRVEATKPDAFDDDTLISGWYWPTRGDVIRRFGKSGKKGIDLSGTKDQPIFAAADGRVVYSGSGLIGYGKLVVLKHNKRFLSAYAHNSSILVSEGETVRAGQRIALMGSSGSNETKLHFEIRRDGEPVDPLQYLPGQKH